MGGERYAAPVTLRGWKEAPGRAIGGEAAGTLLALDLAGATAEVGIARDGSVRLRAARGDALPPLPEEVVERGPWRPVDANPRQRGGGLLALVTPNAPVGVEIRADPFSLRVLDRRRACVCTLQDLRFGADGGTRIAMPAQAGERFLGLGEKAGSLDHRGRALTMRNRDPWLQRREPLYASIPYLLVHRSGSDGPGSCGVLLDAFGTSHFDVAGFADQQYVPPLGLQLQCGFVDSANQRTGRVNQFVVFSFQPMPLRIANAVRRDQDDRRPGDGIATVLGQVLKTCLGQTSDDLRVMDEFAVNRDL